MSQNGVGGKLASYFVCIKVAQQEWLASSLCSFDTVSPVKRHSWGTRLLLDP